MPRPIQLRNLHAQVVHELGQRIVGGQLKPGDLLPREEALAEELQVSRTALREAMKVLTAKGLIEARPKVGTRVREARFWHQLDADVLTWRCATLPTEDFVHKLLEMREVIEPAAAASAAEHADEEQIKRLQDAYAAMAAARNLDEWAVADLDFHQAILDATNNELMVSLFAVIEAALGTFFVMSAQAADDFRYSLPHHEKVLQAICRHRPDAARRDMQHMVADSRANMARQKRAARKG
ncbi:MAG TPA: FadR/GntR family transcriptional regulator [Rhodanobacteraceae bacterium]